MSITCIRSQFANYPWRYAGLPVLDGIVLRTETLNGGSFSEYNEGYTLVHEVGLGWAYFIRLRGGARYQDRARTSTRVFAVCRGIRTRESKTAGLALAGTSLRLCLEPYLGFELYCSEIIFIHIRTNI